MKKGAPRCQGVFSAGRPLIIRRSFSWEIRIWGQKLPKATNLITFSKFSKLQHLNFNFPKCSIKFRIFNIHIFSSITNSMPPFVKTPSAHLREFARADRSFAQAPNVLRYAMELRLSSSTLARRWCKQCLEIGANVLLMEVNFKNFTKGNFKMLRFVSCWNGCWQSSTCFWFFQHFKMSDLVQMF